MAVNPSLLGDPSEKNVIVAERPADAEYKRTFGDLSGSDPNHETYRPSVSLAQYLQEYNEAPISDSEDTLRSPHEESGTSTDVNYASEPLLSPFEETSDEENPRESERVLLTLRSPSKMKTKPQRYSPNEVARDQRTMENGRFANAEVHLLGKFTSNGRQPMHGNPVVIQYAQHSTHSPEMDQILDNKPGTASFNGAAKVAKVSHKDNKPCVQTWRNEGHNLVQCHLEENVLGGSYIWFGAPDRIDDSPQHVFREEQASEEEFRNSCKVESRYGMHTFVTDIHKLLQAYQEQIANGQVSNGNIAPRVVLRCGGTLLYKWEVCYVVIVTYQDDGIHDAFPPVTDPSIYDNAKSPLFNWCTLVDDEGCYGKGNHYPVFLPRHEKLDHSHYWDQVVFAFYLPPGKQLILPKDSLVGGGPLVTKHDKDTRCHKYRKYTKKGTLRVCQREEAKYADSKRLQDLCTSKASQKTHQTQRLG